jgi:small-conductance mechanosensitive channel
MRTLGPWQVKDYTVMNVHQVGMLVATVFNVLLILLIIIQLMVSVPLMFSMFPETKELTYTFIGYILNPIRHILGDVVSYIPNLFQIIIIVICFRYVIKGIRYFASEIANGNLKVNGFYADWAMPTFTILRILLYSFMLVMIWPLLPNSDSEVFQGVSVFIGIIVSLGSTSIVGNIMAGLVMTYMRPFHVGDYIRFGETMGEVVEKNILVTRVRTLKNELITIPNSTLMGSQISNFSFSAQKYGIIVHTKITIGYDQRWQSIRDLLLEAADKTEGLKKHPKPFVNVTALDDSYVEYEINAYTERHKSIPAIYTALHANILDTMHKAGVEIMSPTIFATRPNIPLQIPEEK